MGLVEERIQSLLEATISALGYELLGVEYVGQGKHSRLRLYIDSPNGIGVEDCETVSRQASALLDVDDPINGQYSLEVSSPGVDRPLFRLEHYKKYVGERIKFKVKLPIAGQRNFEGQIQKVDQDDIYISVESDEPLKLACSDIERANLIVEI